MILTAAPAKVTAPTYMMTGKPKRSAIVPASSGAVNETMWVAALVPVAVALLTLLFAPHDRASMVYGDMNESSDANLTRGGWRKMFIKGRQFLTLGRLILAGLSFSGYQFYSGFITTYLLNVRHVDPSVVGLFVTVDGIGTLSGSLFWGTAADRYGRRANALAFG